MSLPFYLRRLWPVIGVLLLAPAWVWAQGAPGSSIQSGLEGAARGTGLVNVCTDTPQACLVDVVGRLINIVLGLTGLVLLSYLLYGGIVWMTAGGEKDEVEKATATIRNAVAGLIIIALAYTVSLFVLTQLSGVLRGNVGTPSPSSSGGICSALSDCLTACPERCRSLGGTSTCLGTCESDCRANCRP